MQHVQTRAQMHMYQKNGNISQQTKLNVVPETACITDVLKKVQYSIRLLGSATNTVPKLQELMYLHTNDRVFVPHSEET